MLCAPGVSRNGRRIRGQGRINREPPVESPPPLWVAGQTSRNSRRKGETRGSAAAEALVIPPAAPPAGIASKDAELRRVAARRRRCRAALLAERVQRRLLRLRLRLRLRCQLRRRPRHRLCRILRRLGLGLSCGGRLRRLLRPCRRLRLQSRHRLPCLLRRHVCRLRRFLSLLDARRRLAHRRRLSLRRGGGRRRLLRLRVRVGLCLCERGCGEGGLVLGHLSRGLSLARRLRLHLRRTRRRLGVLRRLRGRVSLRVGLRLQALKAVHGVLAGGSARHHRGTGRDCDRRGRHLPHSDRHGRRRRLRTLLRWRHDSVDGRSHRRLGDDWRWCASRTVAIRLDALRIGQECLTGRVLSACRGSWRHCRRRRSVARRRRQDRHAGADDCARRWEPRRREGEGGDEGGQHHVYTPKLRLAGRAGEI
mmetsp:Transcript_34009/g.112579  ORF Transcript_34009/g.112579 Transcript_34009/m.112579 type:complete len:422 (-) Transcript_34009:384-1649(-)